MKRSLLIAVAAAALVTSVSADRVSAYEGIFRVRKAQRQAQLTPWHGNYYSAGWGMPVALVVPPTAEYQTDWGWGVGNTRVTPIGHQFGRNYPGPGQYDRSGFRPAPPWPSDTRQFGVYYIRGPW